ncbi:MAG TPA: energy transducer TonB [Vitreimonas sp.]|jgi:TonB family protein|nr:energy transducer TonB [Vitreimonas sp.]
MVGRTLAFSALIGIALVVGNAQALPNDPIIENYRAYTAALQQGDMRGAEAPAEAALQASQARFGNGHRTPVLALNLARLRLGLGKARDAVEPATLAFEAAQQLGSESGVDPLMAEITLARAELASVPGRGRDRMATPGSAHVLATLQAAANRHDLDADAYAAATELGLWSLAAQRYDDMRTAYEAAIAHVAGAPRDIAVARAVARIGVATAIAIPGLMRRSGLSMNDAYQALTEAMTELWPIVQQESSSVDVTDADKAFARALAWQSVIYGPAHRSGGYQDVQNPQGGACHYQLHGAGNLDHYYPQRALHRGESGVVVIRATFDGTGKVLHAETVASAPDEDFSVAGQAVVQTLSIVRAADAPPGCTLPRQRFIPVRFSA